MFDVLKSFFKSQTEKQVINTEEKRSSYLSPPTKTTSKSSEPENVGSEYFLKIVVVGGPGVGKTAIV